MRRVRPAAAAIVVFLASAAVLVMEILTARLMAPYLGVSLDTYTGIIGTVLAGIAAGAWIGGRAADRFAPQLILGPILVLGGLLALISPTLVNALGPSVAGGGVKAIVGLSLSTVFLPALVLSAVTPVVVKLQLRDLDTTGTVVGRLSAFATAGALVGTFGTGFFLVSRAPTRLIVAGTAVLVMAVGALVAWRLMRRISVTSLLVLATVTAGAGGAALGVTGPCKTESAYFCINVIAEPPGPVRILVLDDLTHSYVDLDNPRNLGFPYIVLMAATIDAVAPGGDGISLLQIGGGGFSLPQYVATTRPASTIDVMELDQTVVDTARRDLGLRTGPRLRVDVGDARLLVREKAPRSYDFILGDAFGSRSVPWHLTTREFLLQLRRLLRPGGAYVMNLIDHRELRFLKAQAATMLEVFPRVTLLPAPSNFVLVGSSSAIDTRRVANFVSKRGLYISPMMGAKLRRFVGRARVLRDDFAPVDQLAR
jgi:MFS family permease